MQEASHVQGGNAKNGLKGIQSDYPIWTTISSFFDETRTFLWLWSESRWEFSTVTTPESVASRFSLVCSNDYQRSLSKVNCFVADLSMFKSYYYQLLSYSSQGIWQYVNVLVCLHGRKNDWRPGIWTSLRQVSYGPQPPSSGLCIFWTKTFLVKGISFLRSIIWQMPFSTKIRSLSY